MQRRGFLATISGLILAPKRALASLCSPATTGWKVIAFGLEEASVVTLPADPFAGDIHAYITAEYARKLQEHLDRAMAEEERIMLYGDPTAPVPTGVIYASDPDDDFEDLDYEDTDCGDWD